MRLLKAAKMRILCDIRIYQCLTVYKYFAEFFFAKFQKAFYLHVIFLPFGESFSQTLNLGHL